MYALYLLDLYKGVAPRLSIDAFDFNELVRVRYVPGTCLFKLDILDMAVRETNHKVGIHVVPLAILILCI